MAEKWTDENNMSTDENNVSNENNISNDNDVREEISNSQTSYEEERLHPEMPDMKGMSQMPYTHGMQQMYSMHTMPCVPQETVLRNVKLARAYVPFQRLCNVYSPIESLDKGTAFPELYSPYKGVDKNYKPPRM
ncbi:spore coat associated protein CotJA [Herbivorax sp. ANBcel31]|uniref:spore coat associated protein CotJA n=1 Tax=Herbivorax sp. ANBcel31 TaxID=3069754 RepID=UPI0027B2A6F9|nr:spore coat associated protein CotJA [Herbivorax sp. ANBcel31]MDQ2087679.1 spore coat associated protein CotJA [Herbivorax sp. ANBcel31]